MLSFKFCERFLYFNYMNVTETLLLYMIHLLRWTRFHTTILIFSLLETEQKTERN